MLTCVKRSLEQIATWAQQLKNREEWGAQQWGANGKAPLLVERATVRAPRPADNAERAGGADGALVPVESQAPHEQILAHAAWLRQLLVQSHEGDFTEWHTWISSTSEGPDWCPHPTLCIYSPLLWCLCELAAALPPSCVADPSLEGGARFDPFEHMSPMSLGILHAQCQMLVSLPNRVANGVYAATRFDRAGSLSRAVEEFGGSRGADDEAGLEALLHAGTYTSLLIQSVGMLLLCVTSISASAGTAAARCEPRFQASPPVKTVGRGQLGECAAPEASPVTVSHDGARAVSAMLINLIVEGGYAPDLAHVLRRIALACQMDHECGEVAIPMPILAEVALRPSSKGSCECRVTMCKVTPEVSSGEAGTSYDRHSDNRGGNGGARAWRTNMLKSLAFAFAVVCKCTGASRLAPGGALSERDSVKALRSRWIAFNALFFFGDPSKSAGREELHRVAADLLLLDIGAEVAWEVCSCEPHEADAEGESPCVTATCGRCEASVAHRYFSKFPAWRWMLVDVVADTLLVKIPTTHLLGAADSRFLFAVVLPRMCDMSVQVHLENHVAAAAKSQGVGKFPVGPGVYAGPSPAMRAEEPPTVPLSSVRGGFLLRVSQALLTLWESDALVTNCVVPETMHRLDAEPTAAAPLRRRAGPLDGGHEASATESLHLSVTRHVCQLLLLWARLCVLERYDSVALAGSLVNAGFGQASRALLHPRSEKASSSSGPSLTNGRLPATLLGCVLNGVSRRIEKGPEQQLEGAVVASMFYCFFFSGFAAACSTNTAATEAGWDAVGEEEREISAVFAGGHGHPGEVALSGSGTFFTVALLANPEARWLFFRRALRWEGSYTNADGHQSGGPPLAVDVRLGAPSSLCDSGFKGFPGFPGVLEQWLQYELDAYDHTQIVTDPSRAIGRRDENVMPADQLSGGSYVRRMLQKRCAPLVRSCLVEGSQRGGSDDAGAPSCSLFPLDPDRSYRFFLTRDDLLRQDRKSTLRVGSVAKETPEAVLLSGRETGSLTYQNPQVFRAQHEEQLRVAQKQLTAQESVAEPSSEGAPQHALAPTASAQQLRDMLPPQNLFRAPQLASFGILAMPHDSKEEEAVDYIRSGAMAGRTDHIPAALLRLETIPRTFRECFLRLVGTTREKVNTEHERQESFERGLRGMYRLLKASLGAMGDTLGEEVSLGAPELRREVAAVAPQLIPVLVTFAFHAPEKLLQHLYFLRYSTLVFCVALVPDVALPLISRMIYNASYGVFQRVELIRAIGDAARILSQVQRPAPPRLGTSARMPSPPRRVYPPIPNSQNQQAATSWLKGGGATDGGLAADASQGTVARRAIVVSEGRVGTRRWGYALPGRAPLEVRGGTHKRLFINVLAYRASDFLSALTRHSGYTTKVSRPKPDIEVTRDGDPALAAPAEQQVCGEEHFNFVNTSDVFTASEVLRTMGVVIRGIRSARHVSPLICEEAIGFLLCVLSTHGEAAVRGEAWLAAGEVMRCWCGAGPLLMEVGQEEAPASPVPADVPPASELNTKDGASSDLADRVLRPERYVPPVSGQAKSPVRPEEPEQSALPHLRSSYATARTPENEAAGSQPRLVFAPRSSTSSSHSGGSLTFSPPWWEALHVLQHRMQESALGQPRPSGQEVNVGMRGQEEAPYVWRLSTLIVAGLQDLVMENDTVAQLTARLAGTRAVAMDAN